jgi:hypothetical protein
VEFLYNGWLYNKQWHGCWLVLSVKVQDNINDKKQRGRHTPLNDVINGLEVSSLTLTSFKSLTQKK